MVNNTILAKLGSFFASIKEKMTNPDANQGTVSIASADEVIQKLNDERDYDMVHEYSLDKIKEQDDFLWVDYCRT